MTDIPVLTISKFQDDAVLMRKVMRGPATGADSQVPIDDQTVSTVARAVRAIEQSAGYSWNWSIPFVSFLNTPPDDPDPAERYLIGSAPTDDWVGKANQGAAWTGAEWSFSGAPALAQAAVVGVDPYVYKLLGWFEDDRMRYGTPRRIAYFEQRVGGMFGRGMLEVEVPEARPGGGGTMDQPIIAAAAKDDLVIKVGATDNLTDGCTIVVLHEDGFYTPYFVKQIGEDGFLSIDPPLRMAVTANVSRMERLWFNRAHPGKYYFRYCVQQIFHGREIDLAFPDKDRTWAAKFDDTRALNVLMPNGGAVVTYIDAENVSEGDVKKPSRAPSGRTAFVDVAVGWAAPGDGDGDGAQFLPLHVSRGGNHVLWFEARFASMAPLWRAQLFNADTDQLIAAMTIGGGQGRTSSQPFRLPFHTRDAANVYLRITGTGFIDASNFTMGRAGVFGAPENNGLVISKRDASILLFMDSWGAGAEELTPEREMWLRQAQKELPLATIVDASHGGDTDQDGLARLAAALDGRAYDYVITNFGENDVYRPAFEDWPASIDASLAAAWQIDQMIQQHGARHIVVGCPALAQIDEEVAWATEWLLNDHARDFENALIGRACRAENNWRGAMVTTLTPSTSGSITLDGAHNKITFEVTDGVCSFRAGPLSVSAVTGGPPTGNIRLKLPAVAAGGGAFTVWTTGLSADQTFLGRIEDGSDLATIFRKNGAAVADTSADYVQNGTDFYVEGKYRVAD